MVDASRDDVITRQVSTTKGGLRVTNHPGDEPALVLMHGFPDDSRTYNRLVPLLSPRRAVTFDFLGRSDRSQSGAPDRADHLRQLAALISTGQASPQVIGTLNSTYGLQVDPDGTASIAAEYRLVTAPPE